MTIVEIILKKDSRAGEGGGGGGGGGEGLGGGGAEGGGGRGCAEEKGGGWGGVEGGGAKEILQALTRTMPLAKARPTIADFDLTQITRKARE